MQSKIENLFNPKRYYLSGEVKKRLEWMYVLYYECEGNVSKAANKVGVSRQWLSSLHSQWEGSQRDPRKLEPNSRAPKNTSNRRRIPKETEAKIIEVRNKYHWGKDKLPTVLKREHKIKVGASIVNRYLCKHNLIDIKLYLSANNIIHFYSRVGTPTDNPRVERAHLTDDQEFWSQGNLCKNLKTQIEKLAVWDQTYNHVRPHQALGNLTPIEFYKLWKKDPDQAYVIKDKYQKYLQKQRLRLASARRLKKREQIEKLMQHDKKLAGQEPQFSLKS